MKRIAVLAAAAMAVAFTQSAFAADLGVRAAPVYAPPVAVAPTWTGVYLGFNGGWGWSDNNNNTLTLAPTAIPGVLGVFAPSTFGVGGNNNNNANGPIFGGQLGYNYQAGNWVFGVEGDVDGANIRNNQGGAIFLPAAGGLLGSGFINAKQEWLASIRGRLGYTWGPGMIYVTGGGAWTSVQVNGGATIATPVSVETSTFSNTTTKSGWVVGAGYEWMIAPNWALRGEYLYYGFTGNNNNNNNGALTFPISGITVTGNTGKLNTSVVRLGLDYKFDWLH